MDKLVTGQKCPKCGQSQIVYTYNQPVAAVIDSVTQLVTSPAVDESIQAKCICNYTWNLAPMDSKLQ